MKLLGIFLLLLGATFLESQSLAAPAEEKIIPCPQPSEIVWEKKSSEMYGVYQHIGFVEGWSPAQVFSAKAIESEHISLKRPTVKLLGKHKWLVSCEYNAKTHDTQDFQFLLSLKVNNFKKCQPGKEEVKCK